MTLKSRIARLEGRRQPELRRVYCATSEEAARRAGIPLADCWITGDPEDDPPVLFYEAASYEDALLQQLEQEEGADGASA